MPKTATTAESRIFERDISNLTTRLDRHLEIYAQNGKELAALRVSVDNLGRTIGDSSRSYDNDQTVIHSEFRAYTDKVNRIELDLSKLAAKIAVYATIGSTVSSALVSALIKIFL